jgi:hypothetical protein
VEPRREEGKQGRRMAMKGARSMGRQAQIMPTLASIRVQTERMMNVPKVEVSLMRVE